MSLHPQTGYVVPAETAKVAKAIFPKGNLCITMADCLSSFLCDQDFSALFSSKGQPGASPLRLALVTILQYIEGLTDRQAADAVRSRIDWKYLLCLELIDAGFDHTVLSEFRTRLITEHAESLVFEQLLVFCQQQGWLQTRSRQRTDSTHVLAADSSSDSTRMCRRDAAGCAECACSCCTGLVTSSKSASMARTL